MNSNTTMEAMLPNELFHDIPSDDGLYDGLPEDLYPESTNLESAIDAEFTDHNNTSLIRINHGPIQTAYGFEKHIVFSLSGTKFAVPMSHILEVSELTHYTPVPDISEWILGVTNLRGEIISVTDLRALMEPDPESDSIKDAKNLLISQTFEGDITTGLVVEDVLGVTNISASQIQYIDTVSDDRLTSYIRGVHPYTDGLLSVLNLEGLLRSLEIAN